ncbi:rhomboid family intramembrane serine protease [Marinilabiliaceae bacterium ANBcel2]|nr:rhomboid family intramembrane serine protease [Marinilabiliaceae bacterium ANBcel2]
MTIIDEIKDSFKNGSILTRLIYINIAIFLIFRFIQLFMVMAGINPNAIQEVLAIFSVPSDPLSLIIKPWTFFSYMFLHFHFFHLLFNILYLYWFGKLFMQLIGEKLLLKTYILGGLAGAVLYIIAYNFVPGFYNQSASSILLGASASVMAILFAVAKFAPEHTIYLLFFGQVKLKYIALIAFIIDLISIPTMNNTGGHLAHIGGALIGYIMGSRWSSHQPLFKKTSGNRDIISTLFKRSPSMKVTHKRPVTDMEYNKQKAREQKEVDRILEKIKTSGYESLTAAEKKRLFDASKE